MKIGSLFSGVGGLDRAAEAAFGGRTVWQCEIDRHARKVLRARWPDAVLHDDVRTLTADTVEPIDVLTGGFPCQDLSVAGKRAGLDGARSGLYGEMLRIASELRPTWIVFENVPPLLKYRSRVEADLERMGYGSVWQVCEASDVGAPHRRQRVFVVARRGMCAHVMLPRPSAQRDLFVPAFGGAAADGLWPTPLADGDRSDRFAQGGEPLGHAARWPTPTRQDGCNNGGPSQRERNTPPLNAVVGTEGVLNPAWVELLMGLPPGWTDPACDQLGAHVWPAGRGEPQHPAEPPRLVPAKSVPSRGARLKALGNAVVWQQAEAVIRRAIAVVRQHDQA